MKSQKKVSGYLLILVIIVIFTIISMISIGWATGEITSSFSSSEGIKEYRNIQDAENSLGFSVYIPQYIYDNSNNITNIQSTLGQILEIDANNFVFKASQLISYNADILGMYEDCEKDIIYTVSNDDNGVEFLRYRLGYPEYEHCTIINWCTDETTHGLIINNVLEENDIIELVGVQKEQLVSTNLDDISSNDKYVDDNNDTDVDNIEYITYTVGENYNKHIEVNLPEFKSNLNIIDESGIAMFYLDKTLIMAIVYNDLDIANNSLSGQSEIKIADDVVVKYRAENPFDNSHVDYNNYNIFIESIKNINSTIVVK